MDEATLIQYAKDGDLDAFNRLVLAYQDIVYSQAYRMLGEHEAADDAAQEAFISAFRSIHSFRGGSFRAWILRIVTNACYDALRYYQRHPTTSLGPIDQEGDEFESPVWLADEHVSPEEALERVELNHAIQNCIDGLPVDFRVVIYLVDVQGLDYSEAALAIGKPIGTVKSRLARARVRLRDCLQGFRELLPVKFRLESEA